SINVGGRDTDDSYPRDTPPRRFGHGAFDPGNWWCAVDTGPGDGAARLIVGSGVPFPPFVDEAGRRDTAAELEALEAVGPPRNHLMSAAITWAETRGADPKAAEALALAIEGWRWSPCSYGAL